MEVGMYVVYRDKIYIITSIRDGIAEIENGHIWEAFNVSLKEIRPFFLQTDQTFYLSYYNAKTGTVDRRRVIMSSIRYTPEETQIRFNEEDIHGIVHLREVSLSNFKDANIEFEP